MNAFQNVPWAQIATALAEKVERSEGVEGALLGVGLGAATAIANLNAANRAINPATVLASAAAGLAYGAVQKDRLRFFKAP